MWEVVSNRERTSAIFNIPPGVRTRCASRIKSAMFVPMSARENIPTSIVPSGRGTFAMSQGVMRGLPFDTRSKECTENGVVLVSIVLLLLIFWPSLVAPVVQF